MHTVSELIKENTEKLLDRFSYADARRIAITTACNDCAGIPKVAEAGSINLFQDTEIQVMHNGVIIKKGCYHGQWMTEIIRELKGHHEPQEEALFHWALSQIKSPQPTFMELGAFWSYYACWFLKDYAKGKAVLIEPDPNNFKTGKQNLALNQVSKRTTFLRGSCGSIDLPPQPFICESDMQERTIPQRSIPSIMKETGLDYVDLLLMDIQGAELDTLIGAQDLLKNNQIGCLFISTHHHSISNNVFIHQQSLELLKECGGTIVAEHEVHESYSGDGLIIVSFGDFPSVYEGPLSYNRSCNSIFAYPLEEIAQTEYKLAS